MKEVSNPQAVNHNLGSSVQHYVILHSPHQIQIQAVIFLVQYVMFSFSFFLFFLNRGGNRALVLFRFRRNVTQIFKKCIPVITWHAPLIKRSRKAVDVPAEDWIRGCYASGWVRFSVSRSVLERLHWKIHKETGNELLYHRLRIRSWKILGRRKWDYRQSQSEVGCGFADNVK